MTTLQQITGSQTTAKIIVKTNGIAPTALRQTINQHHRARHKRHILTQPLSSIASAGLARRNQHHTVHPTSRKALQQLMLRSTRIIGIGLNIRHDQRNQLGLLGHQASRALIRHVIQFLCRVGNGLALLLGHASRSIIQHQRNRRHRHPRGSGHILQCRTIRHQTPLKRFSLQHKCHAILTRPASQSQTNSFHSKIIRIISSGKSFLGSVFCILATFCLK